MATLNPDEWQMYQELGDDGQVLRSVVPGLLLAYAGKAIVDPRLPFLYAKRQAIDVLMGHCWTLVDTSGEDAKLALSQKIKNLQAMRTNCNGEIEMFEAQARASFSPVVSPMGVNAPMSNPLPCGIPPRIRRSAIRRFLDGPYDCE